MLPLRKEIKRIGKHESKNIRIEINKTKERKKIIMLINIYVYERVRLLTRVSIIHHRAARVGRRAVTIIIILRL